MKKLSIKSIYIYLIMLHFGLYVFVGCATSSGKKEYLYNNTHIIAGKLHKSSKTKIDKYLTYEIFFTLAQPVNCISVEMDTSYIVETFTNKKRFSKTYFIVEKLIDISDFNNKNNTAMFSEIGRNFDFEWKRKKTIKICSSIQDPIKRLDNTSMYRIRYTTFTDYEYSFSSIIVIKADCKVTYQNNIPVK